MTKKLCSIILVIVLSVTFCLPASAAPPFAEAEPSEQAETLFVATCINSDKRFSASLDYGVTASALQATKEKQSEYGYLLNVLNNAEVIYENKELGIKNYDLDIAKCIPIPNASQIVEVGMSNGAICISYHAKNGEFVILEYYPDETVNTYVGQAMNTDSVREASPVTIYNGKSEAVTELVFTNVDADQTRASEKTVDFPSPVDCGFEDTGAAGVVETTQRAYISNLQQDLYVRVVRYNSEYRRDRTGWLTYGATVAVSVIAAAYSFPTLGLASFLSYAGVALTGVDVTAKLLEAIRLPRYPDYRSLEGKFGDIYDTTVYHCYCRVYDNTGGSEYISGVNASGNFTYVKRGYTGIKTNAEVIERTAHMFNTCIATDGNNTMYFPADWG
ncbi:hypothetical protein JQM66_00715 [Oscillibacter valericigenes]|uniref:hypothetical protein n=1 Tax=Oscillibacter valericigenes TaxID=351091 RepID=UPI001F1BDE82|nr:hypothetical protein [Oscillibacter valericigenes]MCF2663083.1 hypothetical protein [Oscillibacter valericigenes]